MVVKKKKLKKLIKKIGKLKEFDGETMQFIIERLGMSDQMLRQLIFTATLKDVNELVEEKFEVQSNFDHRKKMILDDLNEVKVFMDSNIVHLETKRTRCADNVETHLSNIEIALDLDSNESDKWVRFQL